MDQVTSYERPKIKSCWQATKSLASFFNEKHSLTFELEQLATKAPEKKFEDFLAKNPTIIDELKREYRRENKMRNISLLAMVTFSTPLLFFLTLAASEHAQPPLDAECRSEFLELFSALSFPHIGLFGFSALLSAQTASDFKKAATLLEKRKKSFDAKKSNEITKYPAKDKNPNNKEYFLPDSLRRKIKNNHRQNSKK